MSRDKRRHKCSKMRDKSTYVTHTRKQTLKFSHARLGPLRNQKTEKRLPFWQSWRKGRRPGLTVAAIAAIAIPMLAAGAASASAAQSRVNESATLIASLPQYTCPAGYTKLTPVSATHTTHGADVYHYGMKSGPGFDSYVPPAGFNPMTATQAVLSEMNVPARPAAGSELTSWKQEWSGYKGTKQPKLCESPTPLSEPAGEISPGPGVQGAHFGNNHWAGVLETNGGFTQVSADWYQTDSTNGYDEVTWVGIGGWSTNELLQDGTTSPGGNDYPHAWFEYLPQQTSIITADETFVGDSINAQVVYTTASSGSALFIVHDDGISELSMRITDINQDYDSSVAEFITERPEIGKIFEPLGNTDTTYFSNAHGINSSGEIGVSGETSIVMTNDNTTQSTNNCSNTDVLQYPLDFSGQDFESQFCRAGTAT
jgi:Peptidase A4 family